MAMTGKEKLEKIVWYGVFLFLIIATLAMADCTKNNTEAAKASARYKSIADMVEKGIDPKAAGCSIAIAENATPEIKLFCKDQ